MLLRIPDQVIRRIRFYCAFAALAALVWVIQKHEYNKLNDQTGVLSSSSSSPSSALEWEKMQVTAATNNCALLTTLATALLGSIGWIMVEARKTSQLRHMWAGFLAALSTGISLYYGSLTQKFLLSMLWKEAFDPWNSMYLYLTTAQFLTLGLGAVFFADFAFNDLSEGGVHGKPHNSQDASGSHHAASHRA
jgi:hypothetical protein